MVESMRLRTSFGLLSQKEACVVPLMVTQDT